jgi:hypothetical protein
MEQKGNNGGLKGAIQIIRDTHRRIGQSATSAFFTSKKTHTIMLMEVISYS